MSSWDFGVERDGLLQGEFTVVSCVEYNPTNCLIDMHDLCWKLLQFDGCWGLYVINNEDLMGVGDGFVALLRGFDFFESERWAYKPRPKAHRMWRPEMQVGWIKTVPPVFDLNILPFQLQVDKFGRANLDNKRTLELPDAIACSDPGLYKELLARDADIVYMTMSGPVFRKGVL